MQTARELLREVIEDAKYAGRNPSYITNEHLIGTICDFWRDLAKLLKAAVPEVPAPESVDGEPRWEQDLAWREAVDKAMGIGKEEEPK